MRRTNNVSIRLYQLFIINQNYVNAGFPLVFQPLGFPRPRTLFSLIQPGKSNRERDLGKGFGISVAYNFNGGRHLNRPINANPVHGDLLVANWRNAVAVANAKG